MQNPNRNCWTRLLEEIELSQWTVLPSASGRHDEHLHRGKKGSFPVDSSKVRWRGCSWDEPRSRFFNPPGPWFVVKDQRDVCSWLVSSMLGERFDVVEGRAWMKGRRERELYEDSNVGGVVKGGVSSNQQHAYLLKLMPSKLSNTLTRVHPRRLWRASSPTSKVAEQSSSLNSDTLHRSSLYVPYEVNSRTVLVRIFFFLLLSFLESFKKSFQNHLSLPAKFR